jgi:hypothetical protein
MWSLRPVIFFGVALIKLGLVEWPADHVEFEALIQFGNCVFFPYGV